METGVYKERQALTIIWTIENIDLFNFKNDVAAIGSPFFKARSVGENKFKLGLYPKWEKRENGQFVCLGLTLHDDALGFPINCEWSFVDRNGSALAGGTVQNHVLISNEIFYLPHSPTHKEVFVTRRSEFLPHGTLTVRCQIWKTEGHVSNIEFISGRTRLETVEDSFLWPIPSSSASEFDKDMHVTFGDSGAIDNFLVKCSLSAVLTDGISVNIKLIPVSIFTTFIVIFNLSVLDNEQNVVNINETKTQVFRPNREVALTFPNFVLKTEWQRKNYFFSGNDVFNLLCKISAIRFNTIIEKKCYGSPNMKEEISKYLYKLTGSSFHTPKCVDMCNNFFQGKYSLMFLVEDLLYFYKEQNMTDFKLCAGNVSFPVHKVILSARSPVFKAMFSSDMNESDSDSLDVPDLDFHTLNRMLTFLYTGTLELDLQWKRVVKLYYAADKYQIQSLKQHCSAILRSCITVLNVSELLALADKHQDKELMSFVNYFFLCHFDDIMQSEQWEKFMLSDSVLAGKTVHAVYQKKVQNESYYGFLKMNTDLSKTPSTLLGASCKTTESNISLQRKNSVACLAEDFLGIYKNQHRTDFKLCSSDVSYPVHKIILSARSPVFKTLLSNDLKESGSDSLDIPDLGSHNLNRMLTFLYTGTLIPDLQWQNTVKLYYAADKYQIQSLKQECSRNLRSEISVANVSHFLTLADKYQDKELTSFVHKFFLCHFDEIIQSEEWESFLNSDPALAGKTMHLLYKNKLQPKLL